LDGADKVRDPQAELRRAALEYIAVLEGIALVDDRLAAKLTVLANELDRLGQPEAADLVQKAVHQHRADSIKSHTVAASLKVTD
jgi:hypothetical protein